MEKTEALRSIRYDLVEYIQKKIRVEFDSVRQAPVSFSFAGMSHPIGKVMGRFKTRKEYPLNAFLVDTENDEVYFFYFHFCSMNQHRAPHEGYWVLCFRILSDHELMALYREDRKMLLNMTLKRVVDFHGHLCPDLVIGGKFCEYVQKFISQNSSSGCGLSIIAENCTSALDSIQILLGATVGNQRLRILNFGKHNYTLLTKNTDTDFYFCLKSISYGDEALYNELEQGIKNEQVVMEDAIHFQKILDGRVRKILAMSPEDLFEVEFIVKGLQPVETASVYLTCDECGHQVLKSRKIDYQDKIYCIPCFQQVSHCRYDYTLQ